MANVHAQQRALQQSIVGRRGSVLKSEITLFFSNREINWIGKMLMPLRVSYLLIKQLSHNSPSRHCAPRASVQ
jgi:hypothetical protein